MDQKKETPKKEQELTRQSLGESGKLVFDHNFGSIQVLHESNPELAVSATRSPPHCPFLFVT